MIHKIGSESFKKNSDPTQLLLTNLNARFLLIPLDKPAVVVRTLAV